MSASGVTDSAPVDVGLFGPSSVAWRVHGDPASLVAGFRALLLQAVHPLVMAGFDDNSFFRTDPWGRLRRTGEWIATVVYGTTAEAERAGRVLRRVHASLSPGIEPETGLPYRVDDPALLLWVHCTEVDSFLSTYRRCGGELEPGDGDRYVDEMRQSARLVGLDPAAVPASEAEIEDYYAAVRPQLRVTAAARRNVLWGFAPPMPAWVQLATPARPAWAMLIGLAAAMLPRWARRLYGLPGLPTTDLAADLGGRGLRTSAQLLPPHWRQSPAHRAAVERSVHAPRRFPSGAREEVQMPKTTKSGKPKPDELPSTLERSDEKAQRTFAKAHDSALESYGDDEQRAHQVGYAALKHTHEKVGDHWEPKEEYGPSDAQAEGGRGTDRPTAGGVDANASKKHLYELASRLEIPGRSKMTKDELVDALQKANDRESARARKRG
jgi:uncharacterized protein (DUF2236 family)